jgi:hypothetical protein
LLAKTFRRTQTYCLSFGLFFAGDNIVPGNDKSTRGNASHAYSGQDLCSWNRTCSVGLKAERNFGDNFFWVLGGIPEPLSTRPFEYYVIPEAIMALNVKQGHQQWLSAVGARGQVRNDSKVRTVHLPPFKSYSGWDVSEFRDRWDLIEEKLNA